MMSAGSGVSDEGIRNVSGAFFGPGDLLSGNGLLTFVICSVCKGAGADTGGVGDFVAWIGFFGGCSAAIGLAEFPGGAILVFLSASGGSAACGNASFCVCMASGGGPHTTTLSVGISFAAAFSETFSEEGVFTAPEDRDGGSCGKGTNELVFCRVVCPAGA